MNVQRREKCANYKKHFTEEVRKTGLEIDLHEPCLYTWRQEGKVVVLVLYVDDIPLAGNDTAELEETKKYLNQVFIMKDLGEPKSFLGMEIQRDREEKRLIIDQPKYINTMLPKFNMLDCKPEEE